jgi:phage virion morphogenesis protein
MALIEFEIDHRATLAALRELGRRLANPRPALLEIGEELRESTLQRFARGADPAGRRWAPKAPATLAAYRARGLNRPKPLVGESRSLSTTIGYRMDGLRALLLGSPQKYAATHQLGARKGQYGRTRHGTPIPWGDIPARPFLGLSRDDRRTILQVLREWVEG